MHGDNPRREALEAKYAHLPEWERRAWVRRGMRRMPISRFVREAVYERDGRMCLECGGTERLSLDHIRPLVSGGTDEIENLRTLCVPCNSSKGVNL